MPPEDLQAVKRLAKDLQNQEPRASGEKLGGFEMGARALDKCRASLVGMAGDFQFNCPMDQRFFGMAGLDATQFRTFVATGATDEEVDQWVRENGSAS